MKVKELTIEQFMYVSLLVERYKNDDKKFASELIKYLYGSLDLEQTKADEMILSVIELFNSTPDFTTRFSYDGVEYGFIPNLEEMTAGEYIDLDEYLQHGEQLHKIAAILYRPITKKVGELYQIEPYEGTAKYENIMKKVSYKIAVGAQVFFWNLEISLSNLLDTYSQSEMTLEVTKKMMRGNSKT